MLVNDFGSINIDAELVVGIENDGDVINLANGCVCCNIREDLVAAVMQVMARPEQPEYILLEASGVADPSGIALTFMDEDMRDRIRLDSIMCVVDAEQIFAAPEMMELKLRQVAFADMLILDKVDLATRRRSRGSRPGSTTGSTAIGSSRHPAETCRWKSCCRSVGLLFPPRPRSHAAPGHLAAVLIPTAGIMIANDHSQVFRTWSYETEERLSLEAVRETARRLPASVYGCKGVVHIADEPGRRVILQVVGKRAGYRSCGCTGMAGSRGPGSSLIGAHEEWMELRCRDAFDRCRDAARQPDHPRPVLMVGGLTAHHTDCSTGRYRHSPRRSVCDCDNIALLADTFSGPVPTRCRSSASSRRRTLYVPVVAADRASDGIGRNRNRTDRAAVARGQDVRQDD